MTDNVSYSVAIMSKVIAALNKHLLSGKLLALSSLLGLLHLAPLIFEIQLKDFVYNVRVGILHIFVTALYRFAL